MVEASSCTPKKKKERKKEKKKITGSISSQTIHLGCRFKSQQGYIQEKLLKIYIDYYSY